MPQTPAPETIVFVDDEPAVRAAVAQWLTLGGMTVVTHAAAEDAVARLGPDFDGVLVSDVRMPGLDGFALLRLARERDPDIPVVLVTGHGDIEMAVEAIRQGAYDFIEKPFAPDRLLDTLRRAGEKRRLVLENRRLRRRVVADSGIDARLLGASAVIERLRADVLDLAPTNVNVVVTGETGTGKDVVARCLHDFGPRAGKPFVAVNCGAIPETMFESEFFGHDAGAFTGATGRRAGKLEHAHGGTLFLDEVESMPMTLQVKVLRVLQEKVVEPLGSHRSVPADVRCVAATKIDLLAAVRAGAFREDLYYRLAVAELHVPPLRHRADDTPLLFAHFAAEAAQAHGRPYQPPSPPHLAALAAQAWPGNVRELKNAAARFALGLASAAPPAAQTTPAAPLATQMARFERRVIEQAFAACHGDVAAVMVLLDIPRRTLNEKMAHHGIERQRYLAR